MATGKSVSIRLNALDSIAVAKVLDAVGRWAEKPSLDANIIGKAVHDSGGYSRIQELAAAYKVANRAA